MLNIKLLTDRLFLTKIEKLNPKLYRFLTYDLYKKVYSPIVNIFRYKDKYFFDEVNIEISTYCNRKCDYCANKNYESKKLFMAEETFYEIIKQLKNIKFSGIITWAHFSEPLFDERLPKFVSYVKKELPKAIIVLTTNGDILNIDKAIELEKAGIDKFVVTIHDKNPDRAYNRLIEVKKVLKHKMRLQTVYDLDLHNMAGETDVDKYENYKKNNRHCLNALKCAIAYTGDVLLCCVDYHKKHVYGNVMKDNIVDIWKRSSDVRKELLDKKYARFSMCKKCLEIDE